MTHKGTVDGWVGVGVRSVAAEAMSSSLSQSYHPEHEDQPKEAACRVCSLKECVESNRGEAPQKVQHEN